MATVTINYDARNAFAVSMIEALKKSGVFQFATAQVAKPHTPAKTKMSSVEISLKEIEEGKVFRAKSVNDLFKQCGINV